MCLLCFGALVLRLYAPVGPPPVILFQPTDLTVPYGTSAVLAVLVTSATNPTFKWYKDGLALPSANGNTYTLDFARPADAGTYFVEVRNAAGSVTSSNVTLTVVVPPVACTSPQMTTNGFAFQLSGPEGADFVVLASSNLSDWTPISTNAAPTGTVVFTDTAAIDQVSRWYRAEIQ